MASSKIGGFRQLDAGEYTMKEVVAPEGFTIDTTEYAVKITAAYYDEDQFDNNNKLLAKKTAAQLQEAAKRFAEAAKKQQADGVKQTDAKGEAVFAGINEKGYGIYLVVQSARNGKANEFTMVEPFLINVPESTEEEYRYDVTASPKTTVERVPQSPRTGDGNVPGLWAAVLCAAAMTEAALFFSLRKKERAK